MTNRTARNRPRADRAKRKRVARNRAERTRVARDRAERTRVVRDRAERMRVVRDRAEHMRVVRDRAERTRSRYASVRAFVERLNAQPYELFKPRHRPPLSPRQFSLSTRVYRCLTSSILSTPVQSLSRQQHSFDTCSTVVSLTVFLDTCSTVVSLTVFLDTRSIFVSPTLFSQYAPRFAFSIAVRLPLPHQQLSSLCRRLSVVRPLLSFTRCQLSVASSTVVSSLLPHHPLSSLCWHSPVVGQWGGMGSLPSVSHSRRTNGREAEMSLSSWRWILSNQDLSNQDGNEDANNN